VAVDPVDVATQHAMAHQQRHTRALLGVLDGAEPGSTFFVATAAMGSLARCLSHL
jgi:hypothetical protein